METLSYLAPRLTKALVGLDQTQLFADFTRDLKQYDISSLTYIKHIIIIGPINGDAGVWRVGKQEEQFPRVEIVLCVL